MNHITFTRGENPLRADKLNAAFDERVNRSGDVMLGPLELAADPLLPLEAATKQYVDLYGGGGGGGGGSASITVSDTAPALTSGALWFHSATGQLFVGYDDGTSQQWVIATNAGTGGSGGGGGGGGSYTLPVASTSVLGGVKIDGTTVVIDPTGVISTTTSGGGSVGLVGTTGPGITGGPITTTGTLAVQWNAGAVSLIGTGLALNTGVLSATTIPYTLPTATIGVLGGVKIDGTSIVIDPSGVISSTTSGGVSNIATTGPGIFGGPITSTGTLSVQWNAGSVNIIGAGLSLSGGTLLNTGLVSFNTRTTSAVVLNSADVVAALSYVPAPVNDAVFTGTTTLGSDPVVAQQAATKNYVDNQVSAVASAGVTAIYYNAKTTATTETDPGSGHVAWNAATPTPGIQTATQLYVHGTSSQSVDWSLFWLALQVGQKVVIEKRSDHNSVARWLINGAVTSHSSGGNLWVTVPVTPYGTVTGPLGWTNNESLIVAVVGIGGDQFLPIEGGTLTGPLTVTTKIIGSPYVLAGFVPGTLVTSQVMLVHQMAADVTFPANFGAAISGGVSRCGSLGNATGTPAVLIAVCPSGNDPTNGSNYTTIGSAAFSASGHVGALATVGGTAKSVIAGDFIKISAPVTVDAGLSNVFITLVGNR